MPVFKYVSVDKFGKEKNGIMEGDTPQHVRHLLRKQNLIPLEVNLTSASRHSSSFLAKISRFNRSINIQDLAMITFQFATLLNAGMPVEEALMNLAEQTEKPHIKSIILGVHEKVIEGHSLATSMESYPAAFSKLYRSSVSAGEKSGKLGEVLERLSSYLERQQEVQQQVQQALIYPGLLTVVSLAILVFLLTYVVPKIVSIFESSGQTLPLLTRILLSASHFISNFGLYILILSLGLIYGGRILLKQNHFKRIFQNTLLQIPIIGGTILEVNSSRFARTFGMLFASSVPVLEAMQAANQIVKILPMYEAIEIAIQQVREGVAIHRALQSTGYFSILTVRLIASGEMSGSLESMLIKAADYQERMVARRINVALSLFEPAMIMFMGTIVLLIVMAILLPIFELNQLVT